jgi:hypothetical protein
MKTAAPVFLFFVGVAWLLFVVWMLLSLAGIADPPESWALALVIWSGYFAGPVVLMFGAGILLRFPASKIGTLSVLLGCLALTGFAVYNSVAGMQREPLQTPPAYWVYGLMLIVSVLADFAGYRLARPMLAGEFMSVSRIGD